MPDIKGGCGRTVSCSLVNIYEKWSFTVMNHIPKVISPKENGLLQKLSQLKRTKL
jgi:hypothetical protein